jgi:hypothetical protein
VTCVRRKVPLISFRAATMGISARPSDRIAGPWDSNSRFGGPDFLTTRQLNEATMAIQDGIGDLNICSGTH